ncbi:MAG: S-layer homology domain-containing protein [Clostridia bacterium]|nr:S-layer homology domain-containing protein [Clostridia bacterium]
MKKLISILLVAFMCASMLCVVAEEPKKTFSDVDASTAIGKAIEVLATAGILSGDGDGNFRPNDGLSRAELCKIVNMIFKYTEKDTTGFSDVPAEAWYYDQVLIAKKAGYIKGYEDGTFRANNKVTREQACVILARVTGIKDNGVAVEIKDEVAAWALPSVKLVVAHELMALEEGNTFRATQNITRGEFSQTHAVFVGGSGNGNVVIGDIIINGDVIINNGGGSTGGSTGGTVGGGTVGGGTVGGGTVGGGTTGGTTGGGVVTPSSTPAPSAEPTAAPGGTTTPTATPAPSASPTTTPGGTTPGGTTPAATPTPVPTAKPTATPKPTPTPTPEPTPEPDYEVVNKEMVDNLTELKLALENNWWEFDDQQLENIIEPIYNCITDAVVKAESNVITNIYIRKTYKSTIDGLSAYIDKPEFDKADFQERMAIVDEEAPGILVWLFQQFGIWDKVQEMM